MKVLIACEESQEVCKAFRRMGHEAYSCDIQHCEIWNHMEWHIVDKAERIINGNNSFQTVDGKWHTIDGHWDMLICHPPCTYLTASSAIRLFDGDHNIIDFERLEKGIQARRLFMLFMNAECEKICIENPVPLKIWNLPAYTQIIEPYMFGEPYRKKTCLWLKRLPRLIPTDIVEPKGLWVGSMSKRKMSNYELMSWRDPKKRAKTFPGIAKAMAEQWGGKA